MYSRALGGLGRRVQWSTGWTRPVCTVEHWVNSAGMYSGALGGLGRRRIQRALGGLGRRVQ